MVTKYWVRFSCLICVWILHSAFGEQASGNVNSGGVPPGPSFPPGDVRRCLATLDKNVQRFEVLPGGGWDNLQNKDMGLVSQMNYSLCKTTDDGKFLIPDNVATIPLKSSRVETFAEMFEHWTNYTSITSRGINVHAGLKFAHYGISGSFSNEYRQVKSQQYYDQSITTRIQVRYVRYEAKLEPDTPYMAVFKDRLKKIAAHITLNRTDLARYESQLVVRDFGTHLVTSVDVGAALVQVDQVQAEFVRKYDSETSSVKAAASASFFSVFDFGGVDVEESASKTMVDEYKNSRTSSNIQTMGGPIYRPLNYTANSWANSIDDNMVALDRSGDPIYFSISDQTLPDVPSATVFQVQDYVRAAVEEYYKHNIYRGCTKPNSPNFDFQANVDDGTCAPPETNYTFGGVFQKCNYSGYTNLCTSLEQKNPLTGNFSCSPGYEPILIQTGTKTSSTTRKECHSCVLLLRCCDDKTYTAHAQYAAYWCAASGAVPPNHGFLFGGLYSAMVHNPLTMTNDCPSGFYKLNLLENLTVCVSDDYELGYQYSLPFAGFFSCKSGNPLALNKTTNHLTSNGRSTLQPFMLGSDSSTYPRECSKGYSQHLAVVDQTCEINYCVKYGALSPHGLPHVQRPPFREAPTSESMQLSPATNTIVFNEDGTMWMTMDEAKKMFGSCNGSTTGSRNHLGTFGPMAVDGNGFSDTKTGMFVVSVAAISVVATLLCVVITKLIVVLVKRRRTNRSVNRETDFLTGDTGSYRMGAYHVSGGSYTRMDTPSDVVTQT